MSLPLAPDITAPRFRCPRQACDISTIGCGNRHYLAKVTPVLHVREALTGCRDCEVGAANLSGKPMPSLDVIRKPKEETMQSSTTTAKTWKERVCARDKQTAFTPEHAQQKACGTCPKCIAAHDTGKPKNGKGKVAAKPATNGNGKPPVQRIAVATPTTDGLTGATALLELAGYRVRAVPTPAGMMLLVAGSAG